MNFPGIILVLAGMGGLILQIFLSESARGWPELVLPAVTFGRSLLEVLDAISWLDYIETGIAVGMMIYGFLIYNLPTVALLATYAACRRNRGRWRDSQ